MWPGIEKCDCLTDKLQNFFLRGYLFSQNHRFFGQNQNTFLKSILRVVGWNFFCVGFLPVNPHMDEILEQLVALFFFGYFQKKEKTIPLLKNIKTNMELKGPPCIETRIFTFSRKKMSSLIFQWVQFLLCSKNGIFDGGFFFFKKRGCFKKVSYG